MGAWNLDSQKKKYKATGRLLVIIKQYSITVPIVRTGVCRLQVTGMENTKWRCTYRGREWLRRLGILPSKSFKKVDVAFFLGNPPYKLVTCFINILAY